MSWKGGNHVEYAALRASIECREAVYMGIIGR
jgi:hypothetical protein